MNHPDNTALSLGGSFWPILALDHGLTTYSGAIDNSLISSIVATCSSTFSAVVANYGVARKLRFEDSFPKLVVQSFGAPLGLPKVKVCDVASAIRIGARGMAVQIDFSLPSEHLLRQISDIAITVQDAHSEGLPVLFMITPTTGQRDTELLPSLRCCQELGADLIKVRVGRAQLERIASIVRDRAEIAAGPPVLLAGGPVNSGIFDEIIWAKAAGFSGYCVGRNVFSALAPFDVATKMLQTWYNS